jgi:hypothetical protein
MSKLFKSTTATSSFPLTATYVDLNTPGTICPKCDTSENQSGADHEFVSDESLFSCPAQNFHLQHLSTGAFSSPV